MTSATREKIGLSTAIIIGVNSIVGAGIFTTTSLLGSKIGPAGILTYLFSFMTIWFIAQSFARVAYLYPQEGSFYNYTKQWAGHTVGLLAGGAYLIGVLIAMGLLSKFLSQYIHYTLLSNISILHIGLAVFALLTALNLAGAKLSSIGQYILIFCTIYPLLLTTILCMSNINLDNLHPFMPYGFSSILAGTKVAVFGLFGFETITSLFNIIDNPSKNVSKAVQRALMIVGVIYLLFIGSILLGIPQQIFHDNPNITIPQALHQIFPQYTLLIQSISISIIFSIMGTIHAVMWGASELILSYMHLSRNATIKKMLVQKTINQKTTVLIASAVMLTAFLTIENLSIFFSLTDVCLLFAFITSITSLLFVKEEWKSGQNIITVLGLISALIIFTIALQTMMHNFIMWLK